MELLKNSQKRTTSVQWPEAVDDRLEALLGLAVAAGERVSRAELLAMLVAEAPLNGRQIGERVRAYRQLLPDEFSQTTTQVGELPVVRRPGPRRRSHPSAE